MSDTYFLTVFCLFGCVALSKAVLGWEWEVSAGCSVTKGIGSSSTKSTPIIGESNSSIDSTIFHETFFEEFSDSFESDSIDSTSSSTEAVELHPVVARLYEIYDYTPGQEECVAFLEFSIVEPSYSSELFLFILIGFFSIAFIIVFIKFFIKFFKKLI